MKNLIFVLLFLGISISSLDAQIKRQYRDDNHETTMVVVKDDAEMSDMDILNNHFNLAEVSMGEVIRITTENDKPVIVNDSYSTAEEPVDLVEEDNTPEVAPVVEEEETLAIEEQVEEEEVAKPKTVAPTSNKKVSRAKTSTTAVKKTATKRKLYKHKRKRKRFRLKMPSLRKGRYSRCYAF